MKIGVHDIYLFSDLLAYVFIQDVFFDSASMIWQLAMGHMLML